MHYETQKIPVNKVNLNNWNPNFVPTDIIDAIRDDIIQNGFIGHIVVQKHNKKLNKDNVIINGEHRYKVFKELRGKEIPSIVLDIDDTRAMALTIRLNREHGELLPNKIGEVLREISPIKNLQLLQDLTHIEQPDLAVLMDIGTGNIEATLKQNEKNRLLAQKVKIDSDKKVNCPKCGHKFEVYYG
jgi:ParB-like chromosome segregation protein Spo0J